MTAAPQIPEDQLITGQQMTREEFLRRWETLPGLKCAELIEGIVYVPSPVTTDHGSFDGLVGGWLSHYDWATPGCSVGHNGTWMILGSAPQPDVYLTILPEYGGQWRMEGKFAACDRMASSRLGGTRWAWQSMIIWLALVIFLVAHPRWHRRWRKYGPEAY